MHILIALITGIGGMLWALYRLQQSGVNLNDFNPFYWLRRRQWQKTVGAKPLHSLEKPVEVAACLLITMAKLDGETSREQKRAILAIFESEFRLTESEAKELFAGSAYLLQNIMDINSEVPYILKPVRDKFTAETEKSLLDLLARVAALDHSISEDQQNLIDSVANELARTKSTPSQWS